jgi:hypothetical protein
MSLELAIQANTAAIQQLIAVMLGKRIVAELDSPVMQDRGSEPLCEDEGCPNKGIDHICISSAGHPAEIIDTTPNDAEEPEPEIIEPTKPLTYDADVLPVLHKFLVAKGKPAAESLLKKYAVDKFSKVPATQLGDLLADINEAMRA